MENKNKYIEYRKKLENELNLIEKVLKKTENPSRYLELSQASRTLNIIINKLYELEK